MAQIFVSHAEVDKELVDMFVREVLYVGCNVSEDDLFQSSSPRLGVKPGKSVFDEVERNLREARVIIALVSGSALQSPFVTAEIGAAWISTTGADNEDRVFLPMLVPPVTFDEVRGILPHLKDLQIGEATHLDQLRDVVAAGKTINPDVWGEARDRWLAWLAENGEARPFLSDQVEWSRLLLDSAQESNLDGETLLRYAKRTSQDISFTGGSMAKSIESVLTVRVAEEKDYWLYDLSTTTDYRGLKPGVRQHHNVTIMPVPQADLSQPLPAEPDTETSFTGEPWLVHLSPVVREMADWDRFRDQVEVVMTVWSGEKLENKEEHVLSLAEADPEDADSPEPEPLAKAESEAGDGGPMLYSTESLEVSDSWERIRFEFRNIPHTVAQPAMYFFAPDVCEAEWRFTATTAQGVEGLEVRASAMTSWRDVDMSQGTIGDNRGTVAVLSPRGTLLLAQDAVLVTLHSPASVAN